MEIAITGRHVNVSDRLRDYLDTKLSKVTQLDPRVQRIEVMVSHEPNPRQSKVSERVEITCRSKGPVIRAEACHDDRQAAVDLAVDKLLGARTLTVPTMLVVGQWDQEDSYGAPAVYQALKKAGTPALRSRSTVVQSRQPTGPFSCRYSTASSVRKEGWRQ